MVYTKGNWFVIPLGQVHFRNWVTKISHLSPLEQLHATQNSYEALIPFPKYLDLKTYGLTKTQTTSFIHKVDKSSVIEFDWGSTDLKTFWTDQKGHDKNQFIIPLQAKRVGR